MIHEDSVLYERFVFSLEERDQGPGAKDALRVVTEEDWRLQLSALLRKLSFVDSYLPPLKKTGEPRNAFVVITALNSKLYMKTA